MVEYYVLMYENGNVRPDETSRSGEREGYRRMKEG
jgi:hypothetical protein